MSDDEKISQRYRELGAEEPPRALDDAIMAAARRRPQRWYAPLAAAAVLVLAVAVTLQMQVEQADVQAPERIAASPPVAQEELKLKAATQLRSPAKPPAKERAAASAAREPQPFAAEKGAGSAPAAAAAARDDDSRSAQSSVAETPEQELERIAGLRGQGRQDEADRALAQFRKRYPDYRIPEELRLRVERR